MTKNKREGIPASEESKKEYEKTWQDMNDCFELLNKQNKKKKVVKK